MSLIRELAQIVTDAENEYKRLLESGTPGSYRMELRSAAGGAGGTSYASDTGAQPSGRIYHADNIQLLADGIRSGELFEKLDMIYCDPPFFTKTKQEVNVEVYCSDENAAREAGGGPAAAQSDDSGAEKLYKVRLRQRAYSDM